MLDKEITFWTIKKYSLFRCHPTVYSFEIKNPFSKPEFSSIITHIWGDYSEAKKNNSVWSELGNIYNSKSRKAIRRVNDKLYNYRFVFLSKRETDFRKIAGAKKLIRTGWKGGNNV